MVRVTRRRTIFPAQRRLSQPIFGEYQIPRQSKVVNKQMGEPNKYQCFDRGSQEQKRQGIDGDMHHRWPPAPGFFTCHPISLGKVITHEMQQQLLQKLILHMYSNWFMCRAHHIKQLFDMALTMCAPKNMQGKFNRAKDNCPIRFLSPGALYKTKAQDLEISTMQRRLCLTSRHVLKKALCYKRKIFIKDGAYRLWLRET